MTQPLSLVPHLATSRRFKVVTYNVHRCKGIDGRTTVTRIVEVLKEIDADIIALQEVYTKKGAEGEADQAEFIAQALMMDCIMGPTVINDTYEYGNIILTRLPLLLHNHHNISVYHREPRGCLQADLLLGDHVLHIFNAHFGTAYLERVRQAKALRALFARTILANNQASGFRILLGDFNDWFPGRASRLLRDELYDASYRQRRNRTHPCLLPLFKLDKIFVEPSLHLDKSYVHRSALARIASDHLPLVAQLRLPLVNYSAKRAG
jgi:endonuclease/exonuclease/phosphatase family metal-dependent hydrolase